jgi:predicted PurR-regulated permease PerM
MTTPIGKQAVLAVLFGGLVVLGGIVLRPFLVPVAWACIIAYLTWPIYERVRIAAGNRRSCAALLVTATFAIGLLVPMLLLSVPLMREATAFYRACTAWLAQNDRALASIPWFGPTLQALRDSLAQDPSSWQAQFALWSKEAVQIAGSVSRNAVKLGFAVLTLFFAYRDGETMLGQVRHALKPYLGARLDAYLAAIGEVCRSVVFGTVLTACAQGALAGVGYWAAGVGAPLLLAMLTAAAALLPFGSPFIWVPVGVLLIIDGHLWAGIGLLLWGMLAVSWIDNIIRPLVISSTSKLPFLLVIFGIFGGIAAFGLIGLFVGPLVMATLIVVWREWQAMAAAHERKSQPASGDG